MSDVILSSLPPPEREEVKKVLASETESAHDRRVRYAVEQVEADLRALRDLLGIRDETDEEWGEGVGNGESNALLS